MQLRQAPYLVADIISGKGGFYFSLIFLLLLAYILEQKAMLHGFAHVIEMHADLLESKNYRAVFFLL